MEVFISVITILLIITGLLGSIIPVLPGPVLIFAAGIVYKFFPAFRDTPTFRMLGLLAFLTILCYVVDFLMGMWGAKTFGSTTWGIAGAFVGALIGLFFFPLGLFLGPLLGALFAELVFAGKNLSQASKSGIGALLGTIVGMFLKTVIALIMTIFLVPALFVQG